MKLKKAIKNITIVLILIYLFITGIITNVFWLSVLFEN